MTRALSQDLRSRVIAVVEGGLSCNAAAARFGVAISTVVRWVRAWRGEGRATALPQGGDLRSGRIEAYRDVILAAVEAEVDITLVELSDMLRRRHGASFAPSTVWRFLDRHDLTFKKNCARQRAGQARRRRAAAGLVRRPA
jgi:transposase